MTAPARGGLFVLGAILALSLLPPAHYGHASSIGNGCPLGLASNISNGCAVASPPAFVQGVVGNCNFCASTSFTATFTASNVVAGHAIVGFAVWDNNTTTPSSVVDNCGNTYTLGSLSVASNNSWIAVPFWKGNITGTIKCVVTFTGSTTMVRAYMHVYEVSGLNASPFQAQGSIDNMFQAAGNSLSSGTLTTTSANEYVIFGINDGGANGGVMTPTVGTTRTTNNSDNRSSTGADTVKAAAGSITPTWTDSTGSNALGIVVAFKQ